LLCLFLLCLIGPRRLDSTGANVRAVSEQIGHAHPPATGGLITLNSRPAPSASIATDERTQTQTQTKRINVAVTPETVRALQNIIDREGVSLTEAVRRLIGYGDFVYSAIKDKHAQVLVKGESGTKEVVLLS